MKSPLKLLFAILLLPFLSLGQTQKVCSIAGKVTDKNSGENLIGATVVLSGTTIGAQTDADGRFEVKGIPPGSYNIKIQYVGYVTKTLFNVVLTTGNIQTFTIELEPESKSLNEVVVKVRTFGKKTETPLSIQSLTAEEIRSNPGGNFDISRVIQALPGVSGNTGGASYRNDIIIRGGGPSENVFYLDGIEIPVINHFTTQGSTGGPQGILNVSFIQDVSLASSSFSAGVDNALSSVFNFKQKEGNKQKLQGNVRLSASEFALTMDGPLTQKTTFLASARRSYLQFLFMALDIPIRPNYWDFQFKTTTELNSKLALTTLGVGAIDHFTFAVPKESTPEKEYAIRSNPNINQWNYTIGAVLKQKVHQGFIQYALSRNMLDNSLDRWEDGKENDENFRALKIRSQEMENKFRIDINKYKGNWKYKYGGVLQYVRYTNNTYNKLNSGFYDSLGTMIIPPFYIDFNTAIDFFKWGIYGEISRKLMEQRLSLSIGVRTDMNSYTETGLNPLKTISPRLAASYAVTEKFNVNASVGRYFKLPPYTTLGYRGINNELVNKDNEYISCNHYVAGIEYLPTGSSRITVEGFYKQYANYPVSFARGISLANLGADNDVLGNERTQSTGKGNTFGVEFFFQQKLNKNIFATFSYTLFVSRFSGTDNVMKPSAWDNRNLISSIIGYKFKKPWELGLKFRYAGGSPYSPFLMDVSQKNYLTTGSGVYDYSNLNTLVIKPFWQVDFRVDRKFNFKKSSLDLFVDIQNVLLTSQQSFPIYTFERLPDNSDWKTTDGKQARPDGSNAIPVILNNEDVTVVPTFGFIWEF